MASACRLGPCFLAAAVQKVPGRYGVKATLFCELCQIGTTGRKPEDSPLEGGCGTGMDGLKNKQFKIIEPFQAFPDELHELLEGPGNDADGGEGDLLRRRVSWMDGARHGRSPFCTFQASCERFIGRGVSPTEYVIGRCPLNLKGQSGQIRVGIPFEFCIMGCRRVPGGAGWVTREISAKTLQ